MSIISYSEFQSKYRFDCQLSQGSYGRVCRVQQIITKKYLALKKIIVKKKQQLEDIQNEIKHLNHFKHPFIVQIKETYNIQIKNGFAKPIWEVGIIMELAKCSLQQLIRMKKNVGNFQFILEQSAGLIRILFILQQENIAHRDIKPANILLFEGVDGSCRWKLADFGLALDLSQSREEENFAGSFEYASPKLKRKFKYPNLKIKTNSFKDDVYSLGVTLLEVTTGFRSYNSVAYEKLREICNEQKLVNLIDIMLEQDEEKRPCFKQLMILIEQDFKDYFENVEIENCKGNQKVTKIIMPVEETYQQITEKTIVKKHDKHVKKVILNIGKPIQCIANLNDIIMCGCQTGELLFIRDGEVINGGLIHNRNVSQFFTDHQGNIWSIGRDETAKIWQKNQLHKALQTEVKLIKIQQKKLFSKKKEISHLAIDIENEYFHEIKFPVSNKSGASCFFGVDQYHFAVGFYDGYVYIRWDQCQYSYQLFTKTVTSIKHSKNRERFWICSLDGQVKCILSKQLSLMNRFFYREQVQFIELFLHEQGDEEFSSLLTLSGKQIILNSNLQCVFDNQLMKSRILSAVKSDKNCFILSDTGEIMDSNQEKIAELNTKGWNCLMLKTDQLLIAGSFSGELAWISW